MQRLVDARRDVLAVRWSALTVRWSILAVGRMVRWSYGPLVVWSWRPRCSTVCPTVRPVVHVRWSASDGPSNGSCQMVRVRWSASDGPHQMVRIRWSASDGPNQMVCVGWSTSDGPNQMVCVRWSMSDGPWSDGLREQQHGSRRLHAPANVGWSVLPVRRSNGPCQMVRVRWSARAVLSMLAGSFTRPLTSDGPSCLSDGPTVRVRWSVSDGLREQQHAVCQLHAPADVGWSVLPVRRSNGPCQMVRGQMVHPVVYQMVFVSSSRLHTPADVRWSNGPCQMVRVRWSARAAACWLAASRAR